MASKEKNIFAFYGTIFTILFGIGFSNAEYCKSNADIPFDDIPENSYEWDDYFQKLFSDLSSYYVQRNTSRFNVKNIEDWDNNGVLEGLTVNKQNAENFFDKVKSTFQITRPSYLDGKSLTPTQLKKLNNIIDFTLKSKITISCTNDSILVTGNYISLEKLRSVYEKDKNKAGCATETLEQKQSIKIFSSNTIFFDVNVTHYLFPSLKKMLPLIFIAPKWDIIEPVLINLNGAHGGKYDLPDQPATTESSKFIQTIPRDTPKFQEPNPEDEGKKGASLSHIINNYNQHKHHYLNLKQGKAGLPGKPGGNFFGIGQEFQNGNYLLVMNVGGVGDSGFSGLYGKDTVRYTIRKKSNGCFEVFDDKNLQVPYIINGGDGGKKGVGGAAGNFTLIDLGDGNKILAGVQNITHPGRDGLPGWGGTGGVIVDNFVREPGVCYVDLDNKPFVHLNLGNITAQYGRDDFVPLDIVLPPFDYYEISEAKVVKEYQNYFRKNFDISMKDLSKLEFIERMNEEANNRSLFSADDFYKELEELEREYFEAENKDNLNPFYDLLSEKIFDYAKYITPDKYFDESILIKFLYTATLSKKNFIEKNKESDFVVDAEKYLENLRIEYQENNLMETKTNILINLKKRLKLYQKNIEKEQEEAKQIANTEVENSLKELEQTITTSIETLKVEIKNEIDSNRENETALKDLQSHLLTDLIVGSSFEIGKLMNAAFGCLGPEAQVFSKFSGGILELGESFATSGAKNRKEAFTKFQKSFGEAAKKMYDMSETIGESRKKQELENKKKLLKKLSKSKELKEVNLVSWKNLTDAVIDDLDKKAVEAKLDAGKKELEAEANTKKPTKFVRAFKFYEKYETLINQAPVSAVNMYFKVLDFFTEKESLEKFLEQNNILFDQLKDFEKYVVPDMLDQLNQLVKQLSNLGKDAGKKSKAGFDAIRLRLQSLLTKTKAFFEKNLGNYKSKDDFINIISTFEKLLPYLLTSNNIIQDLNNQLYMSELMTDLQSITVDGKYDDLSIKINKLDVMINYNVLLKKYKVAYEAFEQYVFPFGDKYLAELKLADNLYISDVKNDIISVAKTVGSEIDVICKKVREFNPVITQEDQSVLSVDFNSKSVSTRPFFVWSPEEHGEVVAKFLSGKEVYATANVLKTVYNKAWQAVKFNKIYIDFKMKNTTAEEKLDKMLKHFRISLTHLGDNHYRLQNKVYSVRTQKILLDYYYDPVANGQNGALAKLNNNKFTLSPYASWKIQLIPAIEGSETDNIIKELKKLANSVYLELSGRALIVNFEKKNVQYKPYNYQSLQTCDIIEEKGSRMQNYGRSVKEVINDLTQLIDYV